jgi:hypothetical protein
MYPHPLVSSLVRVMSKISTVSARSLRQTPILKALLISTLIAWGSGAMAQPQDMQSQDGSSAPPASSLPAGSGVSRTAHWNMRRWVAKDGGVHYGDAAAAPAHADRVTVMGTSDLNASGTKPAPAPATTADADAPKTPIVMPDISSWPKDAQGNRIAPNAQAACSVARANKQALGDNTRPALTHDAQGAAHLMADDERKASAAKADQDIASYCVN